MSTQREELQLRELRNIGPAMLADFALLAVTSCTQLCGMRAG